MKNKDVIKKKLPLLRHTSHKGGVIHLHHSISNIKMTDEIILSMCLIPLLFNIATGLLLPDITALWNEIFSFWVKKLELKGMVSEKVRTFLGYSVSIPFPNIELAPPNLKAFQLIGIMTAIILLIAANLPHPFKPLAYICYFVCGIQITSLCFFMWKPDYDLHPHDYIAGNLILSTQLLFIFPWIFGLTFNIFHFTLMRKIIIPLTFMIYLVIFFPFQYMLYAYILNKCSVIMLPVMHFFFSIFYDVMIFIAFYSWGMSLENKDSALMLNLKKSMKKMEAEINMPGDRKKS